MKKKKVLALIILLAFACSMMTGCGIVKIIKTGTEGEYTGEKTFNAGDDVASFWDSKVVPEITGKAIDLAELLNSANSDLSTVKDKAYYSGSSTVANFVVKGTGTIKEVNTSSPAGFIVVSLDGYSGEASIQVQIGSVIKGTAVRDSLEFLDYGSYTNQTDWLAVSTSINEKVVKDIIGDLSTDDLVGKKIDFTGCFSYNSDDVILITPIVFKVS